MPRRLSLRTPGAPLPPRRVKRELRALERWARRLGEAFPDGTVADIHHDWKLPVAGALVDPPTTSRAIQARAAQALLDGAARLLAARPRDRSNDRVTVLITLPEMFPSRICVFYDQEYFATFTTRTGRYQQWTLLPPERSLAREWGLNMSPSFREQGYREVIWSEAEDGMERLVQVHDGEVWFVVDVDANQGV
ncbi:MAG TPA: DUF3916 domain-containing protein [Salinarimonas sp.]|nr:DUF3916 domain-containing protein [Salinarimonas sp.]